MSQQMKKQLSRMKSSTKFFIFTLLSLGLAWATYAVAADAIVGDPVLGADDPILGSKHDFTGLNDRAGVVAMSGVAFSDYGYSCVYCHIPPEEAGAVPADFGGIDGWNRYVPALGNYQLYDSVNLDNKTSGPNPISMLCLSCHDGTMAVDMVVFKPATFDPTTDDAMHMRINPEDNIESCGKCHNGDVAHDITVKMLGTDLRNDHPISMQYAGLTFKDRDFRPPDSSNGFDNGVKLYNGQVECMTCHNVHDPSRELLLRANAEVLCFTCHAK
jgi:predicted CXXCH cytochrome family protein